MKEDDKNSQSAKKQGSNDLGEEKTLKDVIQEQAREDESPLASRLSQDSWWRHSLRPGTSQADRFDASHHILSYTIYC